MALKEDTDSSMKLAQFYTALRKNLSIKYLKPIVDQIKDINCQIPKSNHIGNEKPELIGSTLLHLARTENKAITFNYLVDRGIDYTIRNEIGTTALLQPIDDINEKSTALQFMKFRNCLEGIYTDTILSAHVNQQNCTNPRNNHGISHFHVACILDKATVVEFFLKNGISVHEAISSSSPILPGYSPLHLAIESKSLETIAVLLQNGAKIDCKDARGKTPLHILIEGRLEIIELLAGSAGHYRQNKLPLIDKTIPLLLENHKTAKIDDLGLTHLHVACCVPCTPQLQENVARFENVNQAIEKDSAFFPGYTPLHFAILFQSDLVAILLKKGANIFAKSANGTTPLDICLERCSILNVHYVLSAVPGCSEILMSDGKTRLLELVRVMRNIFTFNYITEEKIICYDMNSHVPTNSPLFPGMSTLHLAVIFSDEQETDDQYNPSLHIIRACLQKNADLYAKDFYGSTAFHLAFRLHKVKTLDLLLKHNVKQLPSMPRHHKDFINKGDVNNLSIIHIAAAANDLESVELLINSVYIDCPVLSNFKWFYTKFDSEDKNEDREFFITENSTLLHIAVATRNIRLTTLLLKRGANVYAKDVNGLTPIHRVLVDGDKRVGNLLLLIPDLEDRVVAGVNLSHLHVACYLNNVSVVERLVNSKSDFKKAITCTHSEAFSLLPHLEGLTPIDIAIREGNFEVVRCLLRLGVDIIAEKPDGSIPFYQNFMDNTILDSKKLLKEICGNKKLLKDIEDGTGLTRLHLACHVIDPELIRDSLKDVENINSRAYTNSPIWPGCTPLHIFIKVSVQLIISKNIDDYSPFHFMLELLLSDDHGADVSVLDDSCNSPLHLVDAILPDPGRITPLLNISYLIAMIIEMLSKITNFTENPRNNRGVSLFQIACKVCHVEVMKKYLENGCDVNQQIDYYSCNRFAGYTPLHLVTSFLLPSVRKVEAVELLLSYNADCNSKDIFGNTPLHTAARFVDGFIRENMLTALIRKNTDAINLQNLLGETAFEIILKSSNTTAGHVQFLLDSGCLANAYNSFTGLGYLTHVFYNTEILDILLNSNSINEIDCEGRNAIHNILSADLESPRITEEAYFRMILKLIKMGCDLHHQDQEGRTALHLAVQSVNYEAVCALLLAGADINILDATRRSATSYCSFNPLPYRYIRESLIRDTEHKIQCTLAFHLQKLRFLNLNVIQQNSEFLHRHCQVNPVDNDRLIKYFGEITSVESLHVGCMPLRHLLSETGVVAAYTSIKQRKDIEQFLEEKIPLLQLQEIDCVLRLQYRKVVKRREMNKSAIRALQIHADNSVSCSLPNLCCEGILRFLTNVEVGDLISSITQF